MGGKVGREIREDDVFKDWNNNRKRKIVKSVCVCVCVCVRVRVRARACVFGGGGEMKT